MSTREVAGVDFSATKPAPAVLVRAGFRFVIGYLKPLGPTGPNPKELTAANVRDYRAAGLAVAAVWETTTDRAVSGGNAGGYSDGQAARARAAAIGYPPSAVIFAACDQAVSLAQCGPALDYFAGFAAGVAPHPAGGYGSLLLVEYLAARTSGLWLWQTAAWSGGHLSPHAHLYQRATPSGNWPVIPGTDEDVLCSPIPWYAGPIPPITPPPPAPAHGPAPFSGAAFLTRWRPKFGDTGAPLGLLQHWGNVTFSSYCAISPTAESYGPQTAAFLAELAHRAAKDPALPAVFDLTARAYLAHSDGRAIDYLLAAVLGFYGFDSYLERVGFRG
jgi:hypothetical protein